MTTGAIAVPVSVFARYVDAVPAVPASVYEIVNVPPNGANAEAVATPFTSVTVSEDANGVVPVMLAEVVAEATKAPGA